MGAFSAVSTARMRFILANRASARSRYHRNGFSGFGAVFSYTPVRRTEKSCRQPTIVEQCIIVGESVRYCL